VHFRFTERELKKDSIKTGGSYVYVRRNLKHGVYQSFSDSGYDIKRRKRGGGGGGGSDGVDNLGRG